MDHIAEQNSLSFAPRNNSSDDMDEDDPAPSEQDKNELIEFVGEIVGKAYLEKEVRKDRVKSLITAKEEL